MPRVSAVRRCLDHGFRVYLLDRLVPPFKLPASGEVSDFMMRLLERSWERRERAGMH
jgi:hypothetical protein